MVSRAKRAQNGHWKSEPEDPRLRLDRLASDNRAEKAAVASLGQLGDPFVEPLHPGVALVTWRDRAGPGCQVEPGRHFAPGTPAAGPLDVAQAVPGDGQEPGLERAPGGVEPGGILNVPQERLIYGDFRRMRIVATCRPSLEALKQERSQDRGHLIAGLSIARYEARMQCLEPVGDRAAGGIRHGDTESGDTHDGLTSGGR